MDLQPVVVFDKPHALRLSHEAVYVGAARADHFAKHFLRYPGKWHFVILVLKAKLREKKKCPNQPSLGVVEELDPPPVARWGCSWPTER